MDDDPIVEEMRKAGEDYFAQFDYDWERIFADLRRRQAEHPERVVSLRAQANSTATESELLKK